ncbi:hypothetical protein CIW60_03575 [Enterobacter roggenkampii]|uniref:hypothetical protein n=1 Tax=Enterobacter roggenkampii TaxID=1812935 RepID=UPI000BA86401|nr:hypothetical protein [Enterobacter roggenkampii]PAO13802.1 hypothetical protein CIW60_03575 [Enterobacter roggenkampii]WFC76504.1 ead/Ea22-like family protein [Enterobacter roggenkampii]HDR2875148.1 hypothetical protein [Enterobacter roggenkampii]
MNNIAKRPYRADGGDIGTGRLKEIADNPYGDEEKCWLAKRVLALLDELEAKDKRIAELEAREVKLPERYEVEMCPTPSPEGNWYSREDVLAALATAGVRACEEGEHGLANRSGYVLRFPHVLV